MTAERQQQRDLFELDCPDSQVRSASFTPDIHGGIFSCSIEAVPAAAVNALDDAARRHVPVRLIFARQPIVLDLLTLERKEPHSVRIVGRVLPAEAKT
jgi:hypothetical protein